MSEYETGPGPEPAEIEQPNPVEEAEASPLERVDQTGELDAVETRQAIEQALSTFSDRERAIIRGRFGLEQGDNYGQKQTLDELSKELGVSKERIRQIEIRVLAKLRHPEKGLRDEVDPIRRTGKNLEYDEHAEQVKRRRAEFEAGVESSEPERSDEAA